MDRRLRDRSCDGGFCWRRWGRGRRLCPGTGGGAGADDCSDRDQPKIRRLTSTALRDGERSAGLAIGRAGVILPGGISTTNALLPGKACISQLIAVPCRPLPLQLVLMPTSLAYSAAMGGLPRQASTAPHGWWYQTERSGRILSAKLITALASGSEAGRGPG